ncbi:hypothetical protein [Anaerotignum faecicola]
MQETILQKEITQEKEVQETTTQERKTSEALGNIRTAMLLFLIDIYILGFDIIPDFVGWMSMLGADGQGEGDRAHPHLRAGHAWV